MKTATIRMKLTIEREDFDDREEWFTVAYNVTNITDPQAQAAEPAFRAFCERMRGPVMEEVADAVRRAQSE